MGTSSTTRVTLEPTVVVPRLVLDNFIPPGGVQAMVVSLRQGHHDLEDALMAQVFSATSWSST